MNIFKNYKKLKNGNVEEFSAISVRYDDTEVFTELPICVVPFEEELKQPMLLREVNGIGIAIEKSKLLEIIKEQRIFHLIKTDKGQMKEVDPNKASIHVRLPKDTKVSELDYIDNQIVKIEKVKENQDKKE